MGQLVRGARERGRGRASPREGGRRIAAERGLRPRTRTLPFPEKGLPGRVRGRRPLRTEDLRSQYAQRAGPLRDVPGEAAGCYLAAREVSVDQTGSAGSDPIPEHPQGRPRTEGLRDERKEEMKQRIATILLLSSAVLAGVG